MEQGTTRMSLCHTSCASDAPTHSSTPDPLAQRARRPAPNALRLGAPARARAAASPHWRSSRPARRCPARAPARCWCAARPPPCPPRSPARRPQPLGMATIRTLLGTMRLSSMYPQPVCAAAQAARVLRQLEHGDDSLTQSAEPRQNDWHANSQASTCKLPALFPGFKEMRAVCTWEGSAGPTSLWCGCVSTRSRSSTAMRPRGVRAKGSDVVKSVGPARMRAALHGYTTHTSHTIS
jgi:hypothetical protein